MLNSAKFWIALRSDPSAARPFGPYTQIEAADRRKIMVAASAADWVSAVFAAVDREQAERIAKFYLP